MPTRCRLRRGPLVVALAALLVWPGAAARAQATGIERAGDVLMVAIPTTGLGTSLLLEDYDGSRHFVASFAANAFVTVGLKRLVGRERPDGSDRASFPSGHTSLSFHGAVFIHRRYGAKYAAPAYAGAALVAYSRIHARKHFVTDVLAGAAVGALASALLTEPRTTDDVAAEATLAVGLRASFGLGQAWTWTGVLIPLK